MKSSKNIATNAIKLVAQHQWCDCYEAAKVVKGLLPESYHLVQGRQSTLSAAVSCIARTWKMAEIFYYRWLIRTSSFGHRVK
jgi:hypothetical protein